MRAKYFHEHVISCSIYSYKHISTANKTYWFKTLTNAAESAPPPRCPTTSMILAPKPPPKRKLPW